MSYQIVKGWPAQGALDEVLVPATGEEIKGGQVITLGADGKALIGGFAADGSDAANLAYFCIDTDTTGGGITALKGGFIVECDADHYVAGGYAVNQPVTSVGGQFAPVTNAEKQVGVISKFDAVTGKMRVIWTAVG